LNPIPRVRIELGVLDQNLLKELLEGDSYALELAKKVGRDYDAVESSLKKQEECQFLESRYELNSKNVKRRVYSLSPPVRELLGIDFEKGCEILHHTLRLKKMYPKADPKAFLADSIRIYEHAHRETFPTGKNGPVDYLVKFFANMYANPHPPQTVGLMIKSNRMPKRAQPDIESILGTGPFYMPDGPGRKRIVSPAEILAWLKSSKLGPSTVIHKEN